MSKVLKEFQIQYDIITLDIIHHHHHTETEYPSASSYYSPQTPYPPGAVHSWYSPSTCSGCSCRHSRPSARATSRHCWAGRDRWCRCCRCAGGWGSGWRLFPGRGLLGGGALWIGLRGVLFHNIGLAAGLALALAIYYWIYVVMVWRNGEGREVVTDGIFRTKREFQTIGLTPV